MNELYKNNNKLSNCKKFSRCNNIKECAKCRNIWRKKNLGKLTNHLTNLQLKKYKYKKYITIQSMQIDNYFEQLEKVENFVKDELAKKRYKSSIFNDSEYILIKEISYSSDLGYHPHFNLILLTNNKNDFNKKLVEKYNIRTYEKEIKKTNPLQQIKNIFVYSCKFDEKRANLERQNKITYNKKDIYYSKLFVPTKLKKEDKIQQLKEKRKEINLSAKNRIKAKKQKLMRILNARNYKKITIAKKIFKFNQERKKIEDYKRKRVSKINAQIKRLSKHKVKMSV